MKMVCHMLFQWANELANHMLAIHDEEVLRRQEFGLLFENHFLNALFSGLDDMPPPFATVTPAPFDQNLPHLAKSGETHWVRYASIHDLNVFYFCFFRFGYAQSQHSRDCIVD